MPEKLQIKNELQSVFKQVDELKELLGIYTKWEETKDVKPIDAILKLICWISKDLMEIKNEIYRL